MLIDEKRGIHKNEKTLKFDKGIIPPDSGPGRLMAKKYPANKTGYLARG
jgi:hypothetical protein